jgi:hypothetical protein
MIVIHSLQQRSLENIRIALPQFVVVAVGESQISRAIGLEIHTQNLFCTVYSLVSIRPTDWAKDRIRSVPHRFGWLTNQAGCVFPAGRGSHERQGRIWWGCFSTSWTGAALAQPCDRTPQFTRAVAARSARPRGARARGGARTRELWLLITPSCVCVVCVRVCVSCPARAWCSGLYLGRPRPMFP